MCVDVGACDCIWGYANTARKSAMKAWGGGGGLAASGILIWVLIFLGGVGGGGSTEGY